MVMTVWVRRNGRWEAVAQSLTPMTHRQHLQVSVCCAGQVPRDSRERASLVRGMRKGEAADIVVRMIGPIRILTADDHPLVGQGSHRSWRPSPGLVVVAEATNGEEALEKYREVQPDLCSWT